MQRTTIHIGGDKNELFTLQGYSDIKRLYTPQFFSKTMSFNELPPEWLYKRVSAIVESDTIDQLTVLALSAVLKDRKEECVDSFDLWASYINQKEDAICIPADDKAHFDALVYAYISAGYNKTEENANSAKMKKEGKKSVEIKY